MGGGDVLGEGSREKDKVEMMRDDWSGNLGKRKLRERRSNYRDYGNERKIKRDDGLRKLWKKKEENGNKEMK